MKGEPLTCKTCGATYDHGRAHGVFHCVSRLKARAERQGEVLGEVVEAFRQGRLMTFYGRGLEQRVFEVANEQP